MTIESDIIDWALGRPGWQQELLVSLATDDTLTKSDIEKLADRVLEADSSQPNREAKKISIKSSAIEQVQLVEIGKTEGVNALVDGQNLPIAPTGLTIIYGDNGSGKSGYARLIKSMVNARHSSSVLPDVFQDNPKEPSAELTYTVAGAPKTQQYPGTPTPEMLKMSFYDEHCGDEYITKQSTISYRPSALTLLDGLIAACDLIRAELQERIKSSQATALALNLPPQTTAGAFLVGVTAKTTDDQIEKATLLSPETNERLAKILEEEARLSGSNPEKEKARLTSISAQLDTLASDISDLLTQVNADSVLRLTTLRTKAGDARDAATVAASKSFDSEPLEGVGSGPWRALWEAARDYSISDAYHGHDFPNTDANAVCVFCQQPLAEDATDRLRRFNQYMTDTTERDAVVAAGAYGSALKKLEGLTMATTQRSVALASLTSIDAKLGNVTEAVLGKLEEQRTAILSHLKDDAASPLSLPAIDLPEKIAALAVSLKSQADKTDVNQFHLALADVTKQKGELQANIRLCESADLIKAEVTRLKQLANLNVAKSATDTSSITQKTSQLTRQYATKQILDRFTRETDRLLLEKVTLEDLGGQKGQLNQKPGLLNAKHKAASARAVLSEGEQTALGLAGFFTEAVFDESKSTIIFDDPVTSLDHVRRDKVAERLAQLARDRQVVVFTHDVSFTGDLSAAAEHEKVAVAEHSVERRGSQPGVSVPTFPWKAKDFKSRLDKLRVDLEKLTKDHPTLIASEYEERVASWAGFLSETWERCVSTEVVNQVYDRGRSEVRTQKFRLFAKITEQDNTDFQEGYGATSKWGRRHDKAPTTNYVAPLPPELKKELDRITDWQKRLKSYL